MAARVFHGVIHNDWDTPLVRSRDGLDQGAWQDPWYPSKVPGAGRIEPGGHGEWRSESAFPPFTGTAGWARWGISVLDIAEGVAHDEYVQVEWDVPYIQLSSTAVKIRCEVFRNRRDDDDHFTPPDPRPSLLELIPWTQNADDKPVPAGNSPELSPPGAQLGDLVVHLPSVFYPVSLWTHPRVEFTLRRRATGQAQSALPAAAPRKGIVYAVKAVVEPQAATGIGPGMGRRPGSGGDLVWYDHVGRSEGAFRWEGPKTVGVGWQGFVHLFSGGGGVVYGVDPAGDLWWYRHVGRDDGSFRWEGPSKVGVGWGAFSEVFSGGDGILYAVSGTDLLWGRHLGRDDGSFAWDGPLKKVGSGWDFAHVFSGGGGVLYAITRSVPARLATGIGPGMEARPASGGDLMWARHTGREDGSFTWEGPMKKVGSGWGDLAQVFSCDDGIVYAVTPTVEATLGTGIGERMGARPASGGDLMWARHLGRQDGTFRWEGPLKKVGSGWGGFARVFSGD